MKCSLMCLGIFHLAMAMVEDGWHLVLSIASELGGCAGIGISVRVLIHMAGTENSGLLHCEA